MISTKGLEQLGFVSNVDFELHGDGEKVLMGLWMSGKPQPSDAEIEAAHAVWENDHARKRKEEYPSIDELVVALWEGVVEERMAAVTKLEIKRQAVKANHPK